MIACIAGTLILCSMADANNIQTCISRMYSETVIYNYIRHKLYTGQRKNDFVIYKLFLFLFLKTLRTLLY